MARNSIDFTRKMNTVKKKITIKENTLGTNFLSLHMLGRLLKTNLSGFLATITMKYV